MLNSKLSKEHAQTPPTVKVCIIWVGNWTYIGVDKTEWIGKQCVEQTDKTIHKLGVIVLADMKSEVEGVAMCVWEWDVWVYE